MRNILVATDGSEAAGRAVMIAAQMAVAQDAKLTIINVEDIRPLSDATEHFAEVEFPKAVESRADLPDDLRLTFMRLDPPGVVEMYDRQSAFLRQYLSDSILTRASAAARKAGVAEVATISAVGDAGREIVAAADKVGADLVVVGRRGLGSLAELLLGSVSQKVLHRASGNVLTVA